ncbi:hypothetical protein P12x_002373 [Tundrisphaera lichenicola]|uniref:hypothetical protein n=1 Tax=Tundrisphaera lichenicola TaxID=2029860 RepID=UPI003EBAD477
MFSTASISASSSRYFLTLSPFSTALNQSSAACRLSSRALTAEARWASSKP